jgi:hypothetical protein
MSAPEMGANRSCKACDSRFEPESTRFASATPHNAINRTQPPNSTAYSA